MKYSSVIVEELKPAISSRFIPRCMVFVFTAGIVFYCIYSVIQVPVSGIASGHLESGNARCDCPFGRDSLEKIDRQRLFYNRVPKCGSTTMITLMRKLAARNDFVHFNSKVYDGKKADEEEQAKIVKQVKRAAPPCSFDRHVFFINFTKYEERPPIFINIIRDPVERIISSYFYRRMVARQNRTKVKPGAYWLNKKFEHCVLTPDPECTFLKGHSHNALELQLPYFCGQDPDCQLLNNKDAVERSKKNIEKYFPVVGTLEDMNKTLQVLEAALPQFFDGAFEVYHSFGVHRNQNLQKDHVREEIKDILRANLTSEYELYNFVQQRLSKQYRTLVEKNGEGMQDALDYP